MSKEIKRDTRLTCFLKEIKKDFVTWETENCIAAGHYLESKLWPLGEVELVGSAKKGRAYYNLHDIDVVLNTKIEDVDLIQERIHKVIASDWEKDFELDLDVFCYGNFKRQVLRKVITKNRNLTIYFNRPEFRKWEYLRTIAYKFWRSLFKK